MTTMRLAPTGTLERRTVTLARLVLGLACLTIGVIDAAIVVNGAVGTTASLTLVALAPALVRGVRRARWAAMALAVLVAIHPVSASIDPVAFWLGVWLCASLAVSGDAFPADGDPASRTVIAAAALLVAVGGVIDVLDARGVVAHPVIITMLITGVVLALRTVAPRRDTQPATTAEREAARLLIRRFGADTLAPFALRRDKRYCFSAGGDGFVAYRVVAGVALASGDPVCPPGDAHALVQRFVAYADEHGWTPAAIGLGPRGVDAWRQAGFRAHYTGEEAIVDTAAFSLDGRAIRKVRQSVHRLNHAGYRCRVVASGEIGDQLASQLRLIAERWRGEARETGFSMAFDGAWVDATRDDRYAIAFDASGNPRGFLHLGFAPAADALSLSSMRRDHDTPNGLNEFLICEAVAWAREHAIAHVSLNFAAFAAVLDPPGPVDYVTRVERVALRRFAGRFQLERLLAFNRKFAPRWVARYVAYPTVAALPRISVAAMLAEAYLAVPSSRRRA
jgi:lysyl-tRNA synthetase, class II